jgi:hypothetical protein
MKDTLKASSFYAALRLASLCAGLLPLSVSADARIWLEETDLSLTTRRIAPSSAPAVSTSPAIAGPSRRTTDAAVRRKEGSDCRRRHMEVVES